MSKHEIVECHYCEIPGCYVRISADRPMCAWHWSKVPLALQQRILIAFRNYR